MNIYLRLTREFNAGRTRAIITSGQAVVLHRLVAAAEVCLPFEVAGGWTE